jgi:hypothetical protein
LTPTGEDYDDMLIGEQLEANDEEAMDKYLNAELIFDVGMNNKREGGVIKCARGLMVSRLDVLTLTHCLTLKSDIEFTDGTAEKYKANSHC